MRKRREARTDINDTLLLFREKRKWQIALRRYVLEKQKCSFYAPYFGLDNISFRKWIEFQFDGTLNWENFGEAWQLDHIVPVTYFNFNNPEDLRLCWNFINIRAARVNKQTNNELDALSAKAYFEALYRNTAIPVCQLMVDKISHIEQTRVQINIGPEAFLKENKFHIESLWALGPYEFDKLNDGHTLHEILEEKKFLNKFG